MSSGCQCAASGDGSRQASSDDGALLPWGTVAGAVASRDGTVMTEIRKADGNGWTLARAGLSSS
ncbi:hypothetical protein rosag_43790 [Roseisolibacter agri]|uniref:Uncharacterized protein n=1 Tax=Roseisolibacter agri TaxID=2014610 RepID=A0AA37V8K0_9BACT|nr:hypothetical protein rosag_43790 [Roseisolibacter agri]